MFCLARNITHKNEGLSDGENMNYEELIDAMASIVCYNSYEEVLKSISDYIKYYDREEYYSVAYPTEILKKYNVHEFPNIIWALMVLMFGDYGTSPRFGWIDIENKDKALDFLNSINAKYNPNYVEKYT